jgi:hypothetical protein
VLNVKTRKPTETKNVIKFFRPCIARDFTDHGIDMSNLKLAAGKLHHRICPDIEKDDPIF